MDGHGKLMGMAERTGNAPDVDALRTRQELLDELNRLRVAAARQRGKARLSLHDLESATGIPKSSLANYLSGRTLMPADVLDRVVLALGVEPVQAGRWGQAWERVSSDPNQAGSRRERPDRTAEPSVGPGQGLCTLPRDSAMFTGRQPEVAGIVDAFTTTADARRAVAVYVITGMAGVGKTALAVHIGHQLARRFPDRQLFVDLHAHTAGSDRVSPMDALASLLSAEGLPPHVLPENLDQRAAMWRARMADKKALLILDNAVDSEQVRHLLPGTSGCVVLITSRHDLADLDATAVPLDALSTGDARNMFLRVAPRAATQPVQVDRVVALCGNLPLAISLLASLFTKHRAWSVDDLIEETRTGLISVKAENRTVAAAFNLSYQHLPEDLRRFFRRLGGYPGPDIDAYTAAALDDISVEQARLHLDLLCHDHLLTEPSYRRYRMHDLVRDYARGLHDLDEDTAETFERVLVHFGQTASRADEQLTRHARPATIRYPRTPGSTPDLSGRQRAMTWLRTERANLIACLNQANHAGPSANAIALSAGVASLLRMDGPWNQGLAIAQTAASAATELALPLERADALYDCGVLRYLADDYPGAADSLAEAKALYTQLEDPLGQANVDCALAIVELLRGDFPAALPHCERALSTHRQLGDEIGTAAALSALGSARRSMGDYVGAAGAFDEAQRLQRALGNPLGEARILISLGSVLEQTGDYAGAVAVLGQALEVARATGSPINEAAALNNMGPALYRLGETSRAMDSLVEALAIFHDIGDLSGQGRALTNLGDLRLLAGDLAEAETVLCDALTIWRRIGDHSGEAEALNFLGTVVQRDGRPVEAATLHSSALELARTIRSPLVEARSLEGLGRCAIAVGSEDTATAHLRNALEIFQRIGAAGADPLATELANRSAPLTPRQG